MTYVTHEILEVTKDLFENFLAIGFIGALNLILTICAMFVISQDAGKRKIKYWHWNLVLFLVSAMYLSFVVVIFYIIFACGNNPIIDGDVIIDTRSNDTSNNQNTNYNNVNSHKSKTKSYPKYLILYAIAQLVSLCITFSLIVDVIDETFDMLKTTAKEISTSSGNIVIQPEINFNKDYIKPNKNHDKSNKFDYENIEISDDIEDYAKYVFSTTPTEVEDSQNIVSITFPITFPVITLENPTGNDIVKFFSDYKQTVKFIYDNENQGFLHITPSLSNLTFEDVNSLEATSMDNFYTDDLKCVFLIRQITDTSTVETIFDIDIDDIETIDLNEHSIKKGYPVYVSVYSNILFEDYSLDISLS